MCDSCSVKTNRLKLCEKRIHFRDDTVELFMLITIKTVITNTADKTSEILKKNVKFSQDNVSFKTF